MNTPRKNEDRMAFLNRCMNDPESKQRFKASEQRREYCDALWAEAIGAEPKAAEPEPEFPKPDRKTGGPVKATAAPERDEPEVVVKGEGTILKPEAAADAELADEAEGDEAEGGGKKR